MKTLIERGDGRLVELFDEMPRLERVSLLGCSRRKSNFKRSWRSAIAHAHIEHSREPHPNTICLLNHKVTSDEGSLWDPRNGIPTGLALHEYAHIIAKDAHGARWRETIALFFGKYGMAIPDRITARAGYQGDQTPFLESPATNSMVCHRCKKRHGLDAFPLMPPNRDGLYRSNLCSPCIERATAGIEAPVETEEQTRVCNSCSLSLPLTTDYWHKSVIARGTKQCRRCTNNRVTKWRNSEWTKERKRMGIIGGNT